MEEMKEYIDTVCYILTLAKSVYSKSEIESGDLVSVVYWRNLPELKSHYSLALRRMKNRDGDPVGYKLFLQRNDNESGTEGFNDSIAEWDDKNHILKNVWLSEAIWQPEGLKVVYRSMLSILRFLGKPCCDSFFNNRLHFEPQFPEKTKIKFCQGCGAKFPLTEFAQPLTEFAQKQKPKSRK